MLCIGTVSKLFEIELLPDAAEVFDGWLHFQHEVIKELARPKVKVVEQDACARNPHEGAGVNVAIQKGFGLAFLGLYQIVNIVRVRIA